MHLHTKPPSGQGLTLTLKGLCLAPVIATPQTGYVVSISMSMPLCVYEHKCVWIHNVWSKLLQTPSAPRADCRMGLCVHCGLLLCEQLRNNSSFTKNAQGSRTIVPLTVFVCGGGGTGNEIMLRDLAACAQSLSKSRAKPRGEYQSLISRPHWAYWNEEQFIQCNVSKQGGLWLHQALPSLCSSSTHLILTLL